MSQSDRMYFLVVALLVSHPGQGAVLRVGRSLAGDITFVEDVVTAATTVDGQIQFPGENQFPRVSNAEGTPEGLPPQMNSPNCSLEHGKVLVNGTCYRLLANVGICQEDEWLVLRNSEPACESRPCKDAGQLYYRGRCHSVAEGSACAPGQILYVSFSGLAYCDCDFGHMFHPESGGCYPEHQRGPCHFGFYIELNSYGEGECVYNPCTIDYAVFHEASRRCYYKNYTGVCNQTDIIVDTSALFARCASLEVAVRAIFEVPTVRACPPGSRRDISHTCREQFRVPSKVQYRSTLSSPCLHGFRRTPDGNCQKTHSLFG